MANAILTITYIRTTFVEHQIEFVEQFQYGKHIGKILDIKNKQKRHRAPKHILLGLESEKSENQVLDKYLKDVHTISAHNCPETFANELMRFSFEAKPIWKKL